MRREEPGDGVLSEVDGSDEIIRSTAGLCLKVAALRVEEEEEEAQLESKPSAFRRRETLFLFDGFVNTFVNISQQ